MPFRHRAVTGALLLVVTGLTGCGDASPTEQPLPEGLRAYLDQSRVQRQGRTVFVRLVNDAERRVTVLRAEVDSDRFADVTWAGEKTFSNEADLEFDLPRGRCGEGADARVRLTYRIDDGDEQVSTTTATDRYGAVALFLDRDCAEEAFTEAADLELGSPVVVGSGRRAYFELPVRITPTGERADVAFGGFEDTVLFRNAPGSAAVDDVEPVSLAGPAPLDVVLRLVPSRCDPHALAEDKVGTLVGVRVEAPEVPDGASFHLPIGEERRSRLRGFFAVHCGL